MNTAIERLCNHVQPETHAAIKVTKDLGSAAVLFAIALTALIWIAALLADLATDDGRRTRRLRQFRDPRRGAGVPPCLSIRSRPRVRAIACRW
jgi:hypothetical protein